MIPALHILQFDHALILEQLYSIVKHGAEVRPVTIFLSDGRPDKNPGFLITLDVAAQHSKKNNFDALPISIMLQKMSAYSQVEQQMALFSKASAGLVLPHGTFGLHLDFHRWRVDLELEKQSFEKAGEVLAEVWNELMIDNFPVLCEYLEDISMGTVPYDDSWVNRHCCTWQYFLQIIKFTDGKCCGSSQTNWLRIFLDRFVPTPFQVRHDPGGPIVPPSNHAKSSDHFLNLFKRIAFNNLLPKSQHEILPYNMYCRASTQTWKIGCATNVEYTIPASLVLNVIMQEMDLKVTQSCGRNRTEGSSRQQRSWGGRDLC